MLYERRPWVAVAALLALGAGAFCFVSSENLPIGLLQVMSDGLHTSVTAVGLLVSTYAAVVVIASAPLAHLAKRLPRRSLISGLLGAFVVLTMAAGASPSYWWLLLARALAALVQALFWSVVAVTAVSLFTPQMRARAAAVVFAGGALAGVAGVPALSLLGQHGGWRLPFFALSGFGALDLVAVRLLLPGYHPAQTHAGAAEEPSRRHFAALIATTGLVICGFFTLDTYVKGTPPVFRFWRTEMLLRRYFSSASVRLAVS